MAEGDVNPYMGNKREELDCKFKEFRGMSLEKIIHVIGKFHTLTKQDLQAYSEFHEENVGVASETISDRLIILTQDSLLFMAAYLSKVDPNYFNGGESVLVENLYNAALELSR